MRRHTAIVLVTGLILTASTIVIIRPLSHPTMPSIDARSLPIRSETATRLKAHVDYLASPALQGRKPGTPGHRQAAQYIADAFDRLGLEPLSSLNGYRQSVSPQLGDNLIGLRRPSGDALSQWILIGAHYDHLGGNYLGADDNASAVAILFETARTLPPLRHHPILFVAFTTEEAPYIGTPLMGSRYFLDHLPHEIGLPAHFQAVIIMDLMGGVHWEPLQQTLFAAGAEMSPDLYRHVKETSKAFAGSRLVGQAEASKPPITAAGRLSAQHSNLNTSLSVSPVGLHLVEEIPLMGRVAFSDYDAFRNAAVPFLFLSAGRTPRYHQPTDLPETLHYERMATTVEWLQRLVQRIDDDRRHYTFEPTRIEFADEVNVFTPLAGAAANEATMIPNTSSVSLWKLKNDCEWLKRLDPTKATAQDIKRLERLSIRMQCLLANFPGCFLL